MPRTRPGDHLRDTANTQYVSYSDECLDEWLQVNELVADTVLELHETDLYDAHCAVRHIAEVNQLHHLLKLKVPASIRSSKSFTPWLANAREHKQVDQVCVLDFSCAAKHVHHTSPAVAHFTSFDVRVGGRTVRALLDSGATCSCLSQSFIQSCGLQASSLTGSIGGIGGKVKVLGITNALVKVRKLTVKQAFHILDAPVAGYHCVLGQDFCRTNEVGVKFKPHTVELSLGSGGSSVTVNRPLSTSKSVTVERDPSSLMCVLVKDPVDTPSTSTDPDSVPRGIGQRKGCLIQIAQQAAVAYEVSITGGDSSDEMVVSTDAPCIVPPEIQQIIEKHSKGSGPLRGAIPDNTHAVNERPEGERSAS